MTDVENLAITLKSRPTGEPSPENFGIQRRPLPALEDGQVLIKVLYLSLDPYMRGRMSEAKSYMEPVALGDVMTGETAGVVLASRSDRYQPGDHVCSDSGWQSHYVTSGDNPLMYRVDPSLVPLSAYLGVCGMPGRTAYFGLLREGRPEAGETLVVSAASGAVGSAVGQIGKMKGLRVVGIAGGPDKCAYLTEELGFDASIDYKSGAIDEALRDACPDGVDIYFESVGGAVTESVARLLNPGARVPICGYISNYNAPDVAASRTPFDILGELPEPPWHRFFLVFNYREHYAEANRELVRWVAEGRMKYRETIVEGLGKAPEYFSWLFHGKNFGKLVVRVADETR